MTGDPLTASEPGSLVVARHKSAPGPGLGSDEDFEISITVSGVEHVEQSAYGERVGRETLATLRVAVRSDVAWSILQSATAAAIAPPPHVYASVEDAISHRPVSGA